VVEKARRKPDVLPGGGLFHLYLEEYSMNSVTPLHEKISAAVVANGNTFSAIVEVALNTSEQLFALNMNAMRSYKASATVPADGNFLEQMRPQAALPARSLELARDYLHNLSGICIRSQTEFAQINVDRVNELAQSAGALLDTVAKSGPAGSADVIEQVKVAMSRATEAYETMIKTYGDFAERSLDAADEAVQPMIAAASAADKKVARKAA
jgi:hypothetical protein